MRKISKRSAAIIGITVAGVAVAGSAWAFTGWGVGGDGTGQADAASIVRLTATSDMGADKVYPGLVTRVTVNVSNPNDFPVKTTDDPVTPTTVTVSGAPNCQGAFTPGMLTAKFDAGAFIPKKNNANVGSTVTIGDLPLSCQGAHFVVKYTFNAVSSA